MNTPRRHRLRLLFVALLLIVPSAARAQEPREVVGGGPSPESLEVQRGRELLERGDAAGAAAVLRPAAEKLMNDGGAWHLLGTAYARQGKREDALKAFGSAVAARLGRLSSGGVGNAERYARQAPDARARVKEYMLDLYAKALESVEAYLAQQPSDAALWRTQAAAIKAQSDHLTTHENEFAGAGPASQTARLTILSKPDPGYTEEARRHNTEGRVRLRAVFAADGSVTHLLAVRPLPHGLTEKAIEAARDIRFKPATVDGRPVSQFITLEYHFALNLRGPGPLVGPRRRFP